MSPNPGSHIWGDPIELADLAFEIVHRHSDRCCDLDQLYQVAIRLRAEVHRKYDPRWEPLPPSEQPVGPASYWH